MTDEWRIVWDKTHYDTGSIWHYKLQRKKKFLWWTYWKFYTSSDDIEKLEKVRNWHLENEANKVRVVKEFK